MLIINNNTNSSNRKTNLLGVCATAWTRKAKSTKNILMMLVDLKETDNKVLKSNNKRSNKRLHSSHGKNF